MSQTHLHLVITHLPIFGSILGAFVLAYGIRTNSTQSKSAAYYVFIITALGAAIAYVTGEAAEETVENIQGMVESTVEQHEDFAIFALISMLILGVAAIAVLILTTKKSLIAGKLAVAMLCLSIISFGLAAWTGYLGGQIRHTEIGNATSSLQNAEVDHDD